MFERILEIINQFGGRHNVLVIGLFVASFFLINSLIKKKILRLTFSIFTGIFVILQLVSLFFTQFFINYQFFLHFNMKGTSGIYGLYIPHMFIAVILLLIVIFSFYWSPTLIYEKLIPLLKKNNYSKEAKAISIMIVILFFYIILTKGTFLSDSKSFFSTLHFNSEAFETVLQKNGINDYITPRQINCKKGKNIIVISLESIERAFLSDKFSQLTPNLQKLKNEWTYCELKQNSGSGWTSGSLYTYLTGFPAYFGIHGNNIFQTAYHSEISSISHVLEKAGYDTIYMNGNTGHAGVSALLHSLHFSKIIDKRSIKTTGHESIYGIRDKDLFELAKKEVEHLLALKKSFALFISTNDTHFPDGIYDSRMERVVPKQDSNLEFMVSAVDFMVGDFISFLGKKGLFSNTVVYIFPDHLKMGNPSMFKGTGKRGLYLLSSATNKELSICTSKPLYQIDLPKIILNGAKIEHNLKFLTDYIQGNKEEYLKNNILQITEINTNGLLRLKSRAFDMSNISKHYEEYKQDTMRYIAHAGGQIDGRTYTNSKEALDLNYKKGFRLFELDIIKTKDGKYVAAHDWQHWKKITNFNDSVPVTSEEFLKHKIYEKYTPLDMSGINEWFTSHKDAILVTDKINEPIKFSEEFIDPDRLMMELFSMSAVIKGIKANIKSSMPSQCVIQHMTKMKIKNLEKIGVRNIAISRRFIAENIELLKDFKACNIQPYAFHINFDAGMDEEYVTKYEMDYIYGIYADKWNFK